MKREGRCIAAAYEDMNGIFKYAAKHGEVIVVHGWAYSHKLKASIKHAWLEFVGKEFVYDPVSRRILNREEQEFFQMRPMKRYTYEEMLKHSIKSGFMGGVFEF